MDSKLRELLDQVPERPPRSKLEPHAEVICELRRKRRTYQEIAAFLREHLQLPVAPSTIHEFVKTRARQARNRSAAEREAPVSPATVPSSPEAARERMRAAKSRAVTAETPPPRFQFDPQEPLTLHPRPKEK